jgi:hypothetical protein
MNMDKRPILEMGVTIKFIQPVLTREGYVALDEK